MAERTWAVVFGGPSPEHEISILTGLQAERVLTRAGHDVVPLYWSVTGGWFLVPSGSEAKDFLEGAPAGSKPVEVRLGADPGLFVKGRLRAERLEPEAALSCLHGGLGEGGAWAGLAGMLGLPTTGSTLYASALGMDKLAFGAVMAAAGIDALPRVPLDEVDPPFPGPYIVKPRFGGSSIGIEIVDDVATARALARTSTHLRAGGVLEPYRPDLIDLNMSFRTAPELATSLLERPLREEGTGVYSYQQKYLAGGTGETAGLTSAPRELPALVPDAVTERAIALVRRVAEVTGLTGVVRVDLLYSGDSGELVVNEVNSVPGAMALYLWAEQVPAATILLDALEEAVRIGVPVSGAGFGSGAALRAAGGIAGKLVGLDGPRA